jgi:hypothetical protein
MYAQKRPRFSNILRNVFFMGDMGAWGCPQNGQICIIILINISGKGGFKKKIRKNF